FADPSQDPIELAPLGWDDDNDIDRTYRYSFITARMDASSWVTLELAGSPVCRTVENDCLMCVSCRGTEMATLVLEPGPG
ncbi:MAG TPA: hypothetical protein VER33_06360, partial [Polyangiaceae bacterium]|nr:hypothetical protein [Polyangiaceae bacterium]